MAYVKRACFYCNVYVYDLTNVVKQNHSRKLQPKVKEYGREPSMNIVGKLVSATFPCRKFKIKNTDHKDKDKDRCALHTTYIRVEGTAGGRGALLKHTCIH